MLCPPGDLEENALIRVLADGWGIRADAVRYLAVGFDQHWEVTAGLISGGDGARWFVTVDELANKRVSEAESLADGFGRLRDALRARG